MINFGWETEEERLRRYMAMPPKRKLELLYEINCFTRKYSTKNGRKIRQKLKELNK